MCGSAPAASGLVRGRALGQPRGQSARRDRQGVSTSQERTSATGWPPSQAPAGSPSRDDLETCSAQLNQNHIYQTRVHVDRVGDAAYAGAALRHTRAVLDLARARDARISVAIALLTHGYCLEGSGAPAASVAVQSEAIELCEGIGLGTLIDAARSGLVESITQIAVGESGDTRQAAVTLRTALADAFARRNVLFVLSYVAGGIERLLWNMGDHRTAALLGRYARGNLTSWTPPSVVDTDTFDSAELGSIDSEAATLDFDAACAIALAALDRIIDSD